MKPEIFRGRMSLAHFRGYPNPDEIRAAAHDMKSVCGIYFLFLGDALQYVGQSKNVHHRVGEHLKNPNMVFDRIAVVECLPEHLDELEAVYINDMSPPLNLHIPEAKHTLEELQAVVSLLDDPAE